MTALAVDAVFFDFDGVLVESLGIKRAAFTALFQPFGPDVVARVMDHYDHSEGISRVVKIRHCYETIVGRPIGEAELAAQCDRFTELVEQAVVDCPWVRGAREFLDDHAGRIRTFTASGTPEDELVRICRARGMDGYFDRVCGSPATKAEIIGARMAEHGLAADRCVMIGDALSDMKGAEATGVRFIGREVAGKAFRFPAGIETMPDLSGLARRLAA